MEIIGREQRRPFLLWTSPYFGDVHQTHRGHPSAADPGPGALAWLALGFTSRLEYVLWNYSDISTCIQLEIDRDALRLQ